MSSVGRLPGAAGALRLGGSFLLCGAGAVALLAFGRTAAALGVGLGFALHLANALALYWILASLVGAGEPKRASVAAAASSVGRLVLLGLALWMIASHLGREAFFGAGGGLLAAQISLFIRGSDAKGGT